VATAFEMVHFNQMVHSYTMYAYKGKDPVLQCRSNEYVCQHDAYQWLPVKTLNSVPIAKVNSTISVSRFLLGIQTRVLSEHLYFSLTIPPHEYCVCMYGSTVYMRMTCDGVAKIRN
jgi:hypothetical protein